MPRESHFKYDPMVEPLVARLRLLEDAYQKTDIEIHSVADVVWNWIIYTSEMFAEDHANGTMDNNISDLSMDSILPLPLLYALK